MEISGGINERSDTYDLTARDPVTSFGLNEGEKLRLWLNEPIPRVPDGAPVYYPFRDAPIGCVGWIGKEQPDKRGLVGGKEDPTTLDGPGHIFVLLNIFREPEISSQILNFTIVYPPNPL